MATYFQTTARNYTDVTVTPEGINTDEFLQATEGLVKIFGNFLLFCSRYHLASHPSGHHLFLRSFTQLILLRYGSWIIDLFGSVFSVVQNDMNGNIKVMTNS